MSRSHLVHPSSTVELIATETEACCIPVSFDADIEAFVRHLIINLWTSIPLTELDALGVALKDLLNQLLNRNLFWAEVGLEGFLEDVNSVGSDFNVVLDSLQEEPSCISSIEASIIALIVEVGNQSMSFNFCKVQDCVLRFFVESCREEESLERDESISTPAAHVTCRKVW